jgi:hypothetical protein
MPGILRLSSALRRLRAQGHNEAARRVEASYLEVGQHCDVHGKLDDPILTIARPDKVAFGCPWCSDPEVLAQWEREGRASTLQENPDAE